MKRITKSIMVLMLSLVMTLGCLPSFINKAWAAYNYVVKVGNIAHDITIRDCYIDEFQLSKYGNIYKLGDNKTSVNIKFYLDDDEVDSDNKLSNSNSYKLEITASDPSAFSYESSTLDAFVDDTSKEPVNLMGISDWNVKNAKYEINGSTLIVTADLKAFNDWSKLSRAMQEDCVETIDGVFTVVNDEINNVRTIKLLKDITAKNEDDALLVSLIDTKIVLDLNGHILNRGLVDKDGNGTNHDHGSVIEIIGGNLTIKDSNPDEEHNGYINSKGLWHLDAPTGDPKTIKGGIITGGTGTCNGGATPVYFGGGVLVSTYYDNTVTPPDPYPGSLFLEGGTIAGNIAYGGGVKTQNTNSKFIMNGGAISYNGSIDSAAGVTCESSSLFTMTDGEISFNTSTSTKGVGGIYAGATTNINGGKIINNKSEGYAGGVLVAASTPVLTISGNVIIKDNINTRQTWPQNLATPSAPIKVNNLNNAEIYISFFKSSSGQGTGVLTSGCNRKGLNEVFFYDGPDTLFMDYNADGELEVKEMPVDSYRIKVVKPENGTITSNKVCVEKGEEVTLIATPNSGYTLGEYIVISDTPDPIIITDNTFTMPESTVLVSATFIEAPRPSSSGSKKYKANDKDTAEKISGSGKKGSTRTITPIEGKKVANVKVTDKDGNEIEVTLNEDGTYSFTQPACNVNVEVTYKNREIKLTIGSNVASVDDEKSNLDVCPVIRNDRTMLPIRFIAENLGAKVLWDEKNPNEVIITRGDTKIEITLGKNKAKVNGKEYELDSIAFAENDRTYLPVRFVSEALNAKVLWDESKPNDVTIIEQ